MKRQWTEIDWQSCLQSHSEIEVDTQSIAAPVDAPGVVSLMFRPRKLKTASYMFGPTETVETRQPQIQRGQAKPDRRPLPKQPASQTRFSTPHDVVRLDDRLFYVLQPPLENLFASDTLEFPFEPFCFQYSGVAFLFPRHAAILADEMGLGKTMQAITSIRMLLRTGHARNVLLICPKPLVTNWLREFGLWAPEVPIAAIQGSQKQREWHWTSDRAPVKVANYELMTRDQTILHDHQLSFDLVVLDEAQRIKNPSNATSQAICNIHRKRSWALTGTPIENGIEDLVGICNFVSPGNLSLGMSPRQVRREVRDLILRRTKDMVLDDMPPKLIRDAELSLTTEQAATYEQAQNDGVIRLNELGHEISIKHVFELVMRLKQICNFDPRTGASSKIEAMESDLEEIAASGQKAIVFSQWVDAIEQASERLQRFNPLQYHGRIPSRQRDGILKEFKESPDRHVLLMSYGTGSVGLNLQFCRYVFLFDRWWNPAVEDQAINRAHRIGAAGSVTVTRMIMSGTIEQRIHEILEAKRELFREVLSDEPESGKQGLTRDEIFGLFNLRTPEKTIRAKVNDPTPRSKVA